MKLIVIEGLDGSGKSTQIGNLKDYFSSLGLGYEYLHFPRTNEPFFGELISRFLRGEFGQINDLNPYIVAMLYAGDRKDASEDISSWLKSGKYVILDRYVYSNIAYQCAKINNKNERELLKDWILRLEFNHFKIPEPSINIFLDVPFMFTSEKLNNTRSGTDRSYLKGNSDIHESNLEFQNKVRQIYIETAINTDNLEVIDCSEKGRDILPPDKIFGRITDLLTTRRIIQ